VPDFVAVAADDGGIAGYVPKEAALGTNGSGPGGMKVRTWPVYAKDLRTVVGYLVPDKGFVPLGVDPARVPNRVSSVAPSQSPGPGVGQLAVYMKNDSSVIRWTAISEDGVLTAGSSEWPVSAGAGCYSVGPGASVVLVDRDPAETGARAISTVYTSSGSGVAAAIWVVIDHAGFPTYGTGVPGWWLGGALTC